MKELLYLLASQSNPYSPQSLTLSVSILSCCSKSSVLGQGVMEVTVPDS